MHKSVLFFSEKDSILVSTIKTVKHFKGACVVLIFKIVGVMIC